MILAAVDVGTNSVKLLIARVERSRVSPVEERVVITRLGEGVERTHRIAGAAADRTLEVLADYRERIHRRSVRKVAVVGTRVLRAAKNASDFAMRCEFEAGLPLRILTAEEEARLAFRGAASGFPEATVVDIGGGSAQISRGAGGWLARSWSVNVGAVVVTERRLRHDPPTRSELRAALEGVDRQIRGIFDCGGFPRPLVGVGGTVATAVAIHRRRKPTTGAVHGQVLKASTVLELRDLLAAMPLSQRRSIPGLEPARADIIVGGLLILGEVLRLGGFPELRAFSFGLRHGLALELVAGRWTS